MILPPAILAVACSITIEDQAKASGLSLRHFIRLCGLDSWDTWRIGPARKWCEACGYNWWTHATYDELNAKLATRIEWDVEKTRHRRALRAMIAHCTGENRPSRRSIEVVAHRLNTARVGAQAKPQAAPALS